jgi:hypothetical protein
MNKKQQHRLNKKKYLDSHIQSKNLTLGDENTDEKLLVSFGSKILTTPSSSKRSSNDTEINNIVSIKQYKDELKSSAKNGKGKHSV